jgi:hypothetical protein
MSFFHSRKQGNRQGIQETETHLNSISYLFSFILAPPIPLVGIITLATFSTVRRLVHERAMTAAVLTVLKRRVLRTKTNKTVLLVLKRVSVRINHIITWGTSARVHPALIGFLPMLRTELVFVIPRSAVRALVAEGRMPVQPLLVANATLVIG